MGVLPTINVENLSISELNISEYIWANSHHTNLHDDDDDDDDKDLFNSSSSYFISGLITPAADGKSMKLDKSKWKRNCILDSC